MLSPDRGKADRGWGLNFIRYILLFLSDYLLIINPVIGHVNQFFDGIHIRVINKGDSRDIIGRSIKPGTFAR